MAGSSALDVTDAVSATVQVKMSIAIALGTITGVWIGEWARTPTLHPRLTWRIAHADLMQN